MDTRLGLALPLSYPEDLSPSDTPVTLPLFHAWHSRLDYLVAHPRNPLIGPDAVALSR